jgi:tetratricopeptide (TPR) repeat protein
LVLAVEGLVVLRSAPIIFVCGAAAFASLLRWSSRRRIEVEQALDLPRQLEAARSLLAEAPDRARQLAERVAALSRSNLTANAAWEVVAWAELEQGHAEAAAATLRRARPASDVDVHCLASVEAARGRTRQAIGLLERARGLQGLSLDAIKFLIDLHAQLGALEAACAVASAEIATLDPDDTRRVIEAAFDAGALASATKLADELFAFTGCPDDAVSHAYGLVRLGDRTRPSARS